MNRGPNVGGESGRRNLTNNENSLPLKNHTTSHGSVRGSGSADKYNSGEHTHFTESNTEARQSSSSPPSEPLKTKPTHREEEALRTEKRGDPLETIPPLGAATWLSQRTCPCACPVSQRCRDAHFPLDAQFLTGQSSPSPAAPKTPSQSPALFLN